MPRKVQHKRSHRRRMAGRGILDWLKKAHDFIKNNKVISRVGSALGAVGVPYASGVSRVASTLGYGRLQDAHNFIKKHRLISRVGSSLHRAGIPYAGKIGAVAKHLGYGRRRKRGKGLRLAGGSLRLSGSGTGVVYGS